MKRDLTNKEINMCAAAAILAASIGDTARENLNIDSYTDEDRCELVEYMSDMLLTFSLRNKRKSE